MSAHGIIANILRAILFAGICSIVFLVLGTMASYSVDSTDIYLATMQERVSDVISKTNFDLIPALDLTFIVLSDEKFVIKSNLGLKVTVEDISEPLYFNKKYFDANYGSGGSIRANVKSRTAHRLLTTADGRNVLVTIDMVGIRI
jgi:hypothetical protein